MTLPGLGEVSIQPAVLSHSSDSEAEIRTLDEDELKNSLDINVRKIWIIGIYSYLLAYFEIILMLSIQIYVYQIKGINIKSIKVN